MRKKIVFVVAKVNYHRQRRLFAERASDRLEEENLKFDRKIIFCNAGHFEMKQAKLSYERLFGAKFGQLVSLVVVFEYDVGETITVNRHYTD